MINIYHRQIEGFWYASAIGDDGVFATAFSLSEGSVLQLLLRSMPYNMPFQVAEEPTQLSEGLLRALGAIFEGRDFSLKFRLAMNHLSGYAQRVLRCVSLIPIGYVTTYGAIAKVVGGSPRAVGRAVASNPFPLLIPCHRVVRSNFSIGGYVSGEKIKRALLQREDRGYEEATKLKINNRILSLFPVKYLWKG